MYFSVNTSYKKDMKTAKKGFFSELAKDLKKHRYLYIMLIPVILYFLLFCYRPIGGLLIAFENYKPRKGIWHSDWVGLQNFIDFFESPFFGRVLKNTLVLSLGSLIFGFPIPILFALFLNEVKNVKFKKVVQTITYLPHFITTVIICSLIIQFTDSDGFITSFVNLLTGHEGSLITDENCFRPIYIISGIWQTFGWNSIIYFAAISGIDAEQYEAARIDGANRWDMMFRITLPELIPTIMILLIMQCGSVLSVGWEKAFLLQTPVTYEVSDIISTYVYRQGFEEMNYSYSSAIGMFNSIVNLLLLTIANRVSKKTTESGLW